MPQPQVWITGAGGLIGSHLVRSATIPAHLVIPLTRSELDLSDFPAVRARFQEDRPGLVIHCAALSKSVACQQNPVLAHRLNVEATAHLAELAADISFIVLSTDLVFDGRQGNYDETATVNPLSIYGETKAAAERVVLANPKHTVVRTSLNFGTSPTGDRAFNEEMRRAWQAGQTLRLFTDEFRCPIAAEATAAALWDLAGKNQPGLYHLAGVERLSRWEIGQLLAAHWSELPARMEACSLHEYHGAPRSPDTSLNSAKIQKLLAHPLPRFSDWLKQASEQGKI